MKGDSMSECQKLLVVAEEFQSMVAITWAKLKDESIQEIMLGQSLYGINLGLENTIKQLHQAIAIEADNGNS
jgi:hypothetical protein